MGRGPNILLLFFTLLSACSRPSPITSADQSVVIETSLSTAKKKFGRSFCLVKNIHQPMSQVAEENSNFKVGDKKFLQIKSPALRVIPDIDQYGLEVVSGNFDCRETILIEEPVFYRVDEKWQQSLVALVNVDRMCGPQCGQRFSLFLTKTPSGWQESPEGLTADVSF